MTIRWLAILACVSILATRVIGADSTSVGDRSPGTAIAISAFGVIVPVTAGILMLAGDGSHDGSGFWVIEGGLAFGPVFGYAYAGNAGPMFGTGFLKLGLLAGATFVGASAHLSGEWGALEGAAWGLLIGNGIVVVWDVVNIIGAGEAVERFNARNRERSARLQISPMAPLSKTGMAGLRLSLTL